ncbi:hypothetical protein T02_11263 [Trichinella nativa]|uniref:Uncharacterized protein n=1 Tax=Trichinella nativa TaxID=6335 RepID=A0A0V1KM31_9BILA|nr:hypothetical protein T02_11263 [Trichinella nativa]
MLDVVGVTANVICTSRHPELSTKRSHQQKIHGEKRLVLTSTSQHGKSNRKPNSVAPSAVKPKREISDSAMNYARRRALQSTCPTSTEQQQLYRALASVMTAVISSAPSHMSNLNPINMSHIATNGYVQCYQALSQVYRVSVRRTLLTYVKATLNSRKVSIEKY